MLHFIQLVFVLLFVTDDMDGSSSIKNFEWMAQRRVFEMWKQRFKKTYWNADEEYKRFLIWVDNFREMQFHNDEQNLGLWSYRKGMNEFSDLTFREFERNFLSTVMPTLPPTPITHFYGTSVPELDWMSIGWVTEVKHQGECASGWAFATAGAFEFQYFNETGENLELSAQELLDCAAPTYGCHGGSAFQAINHVYHFGLHTESEYPYKGVKGQCDAETIETKVTIRTTGLDILDAYDPNSLKAATVFNGPIVLHIKVTRNFLQYESGIFFDTPCRDVVKTNHAVLLVGYGTDPIGGPYWLIKNSWGTAWGENGYIKITQRNEENCGIASFPILPIPF